MSFFSNIFSGRPCSQKSLSQPPERQLYIVDTTGLINTRQKNGNNRPRPRDNVFILKNLAQFASKEDIRISAVFMGHPLREADEGTIFNGIQVYYAPNLDEQNKRVLSLVHKNRRRNDITVLTLNKEIEDEVMLLGATCMRLSTLRKILENKEERNYQSRHAPRKSVPAQPANSKIKAEKVSSPEDQTLLSLVDPL